MRTYYGVDSVDDARQVIPVLQKLWGVAPSVYARYIVGGYILRPEEATAILAYGTRIIHVDNFGDAATVGGTYAQGYQHAQTAVAAMRATGCPAGKGLLFRDIESGWVPSVTYLQGYSAGLRDAKQPGGYYCNAEWATFDTPYGAIVEYVDRIYRLVWSSEPENTGYVPPPGPAWNAFAPPGDLSATVGWQFVEQPAAIPNIDCNLWTEEAYNLAWHNESPKPIYPYPGHVATPGSLKQKPDHVSPASVDGKLRSVYLEKGAEVSVLGEADGWLHVRLAPPESQVQGYLVAGTVTKDE